MPVNILHFSDFHLDGNHIGEANTLLDFMIDGVKECGKDIDLIIFSGDLINQGGIGFNSIQDAFHSFKENVIVNICNELHLPLERFIFIPGNHDIVRNADSTMLELGLESSTMDENSVNALIHSNEIEGFTKRIDDFKIFEKEFYSDLLKDDYKFTRFQSNYRFKDLNVGITSLNSVWRCGKDDEHKIVVGLCQVNESYAFLKGCDIKIACSHYRYDKLKEFERDPFKEKIAENYDILFSGHTHSNMVEFIDTQSGNNFLDVNTAGSLTNNGYTDEERHKNAFQIVSFYPHDRVEVQIYRQIDGGTFILDKNFGANGNGTFIKAIPSKTDSVKSAALEEAKEAEENLKRLQKEIFPFKTINEYRRNISDPLMNDEFVDDDKIDRIKAILKDKLIKDIRFMALSGLGKTRIILDTFADDENAYIATAQSQFENGLGKLLEYNPNSTVIIDNCSISDMLSVKKFCEEHSVSAKLITIHNVLTPEEKSTDGRLIDLTYDDGERIVDRIIAKATFTDRERENLPALIKARAGGIPYMAVMLIKAFHQNKTLKLDNPMQVLETLLRGSKDLPEEKRKALRAIALFDPVGYDKGLRDEYNSITKNVHIHHLLEPQPTVDTIFSDTIAEYQHRQLIDHEGYCIKIRPLPLAEWLTESWLDHHGNDFQNVIEDIDKLEENLSLRLFRALKKRFEGLTDSKYAKALFDKLNEPGKGFFYNERLVFSKTGSQLFLSMGIVSPVMVARNILGILYQKDVEWLKVGLNKDARRNLVWALEKMAMNPEAFKYACHALARLALAESEDFSNNATGIFVQLFHTLLSGTQANLEQRYEALDDLSREKGTEVLRLKAIDNALKSRDFYRTGDALYSIDGKPMDYVPDSYLEIGDYWGKCCNMLTDISSNVPEYNDKIRHILTQHVYDFYHVGKEELLFRMLESFKPTPDSEWSEMHDALIMYLDHWAKGNPRGVDTTKEWISRLAPKSFIGRIKAAVKKHKFTTSDKYFLELIEMMHPFVDEFIDGELYKKDILSQLIKDEDHSLFWFERALGERMKVNDELAKELLAYVVSVLENGDLDPNSTSSFVTTISGFINGKEYLHSLYDTLLDLKYYKMSASVAGIIDNEKYDNLSSILHLYQKGIYNNDCMNQYLRFYRYHTVENIISIFDTMKDGDVDKYEVLYPYINTYIFFHSLEDIGNNSLLQKYKEIILDFEFNEEYGNEGRDVVDRMENLLENTNDPDFAFKVHRKIVEFLSNKTSLYNPFDLIYFKLLPKYQDVILQDLLNVLGSETEYYLFYFQMYLHLGSGFNSGAGPLFQCNEEVIKATCFNYPAVLPVRLAHMCPVFDYKDGQRTGLGHFFMWLCDNFGDQKDMLDAFSSNIGTYSWSGVGGISSYIMEKIPYFQPLLVHKNPTVREWAKNEIEGLTNRAQLEMGKESYEKMITQ